MKNLFFTLMMVACFAMQVRSQSFQSGDLLYSVVSSNPPCVSLDGHVDGTNAQGEFVIPETVEHEGVAYTVTEIGNRAFVNCNGLTGQLDIPPTLDTIQMAAFYGCSGFTGTLDIPNTVVLKEHVFQNCSGFTNLNFPDTISIVPKGLFSGCSGLTGILKIPETVKIIGEFAFYGCSGFSKLMLPDGLEEIHERAFKNCSGFTGTLDIPETVTYIKYGAFSNCTGFSGDLIIPNSVIELGTTLNDYWGLNEAPDSSYATFANCFDHLVLSESLDSIGPFCFFECSRLCGDLVIPNTVRGVNYMAFRHCSGFNSLALGNSLGYIGYEAFEGCTGFEGTLVMPETITVIKSGAFSGCSGLEHVEPSPNIKFEYGNSGGGIFSCCTSLVSIEIPEGWTMTGDNTFASCSNLREVRFPESLEEIGQNAFSNCRNLNNVHLPDRLRTINREAFAKCTKLSGDMVIPTMVASILPLAFDSCYQINRLHLGDSTETIAESAFRNTKIETIIVKATTPPDLIPTYPIGYGWMFPHDIPITVPCGTLEAYQDSEHWSRFTNMTEGNTLSFSVAPEDETLGTVHILKEASCDDMIVEVEAFPNDGNVFQYWEANGIIVSMDNPYRFELVEDTELVAHFSGTGLDEMAEGVHVYPNPTKSLVSIDGIEVVEVQVFNGLGQLVRTFHDANVVDLQGFPKGVYALHILGAKEKFVRKVVKG